MLFKKTLKKEKLTADARRWTQTFIPDDPRLNDPTEFHGQAQINAV